MSYEDVFVVCYTVFFLLCCVLCVKRELVTFLVFFLYFGFGVITLLVEPIREVRTILEIWDPHEIPTVLFNIFFTIKLIILMY